MGEHGGGGGFAVGSGDGDTEGLGQGHELAEHGGVFEDGDFLALRFANFGVAVGDGGGDDDGVGAGGEGAFGLVEGEGEAVTDEGVGDGSAGAVAAGDACAACTAEPGEA